MAGTALKQKQPGCQARGWGPHRRVSYGYDKAFGLDPEVTRSL